jgi:hypothetical protein
MPKKMSVVLLGTRVAVLLHHVGAPAGRGADKALIAELVNCLADGDGCQTELLLQSPLTGQPTGDRPEAIRDRRMAASWTHGGSGASLSIMVAHYLSRQPGGGASCQPIGSVSETHERGHDALAIARDAAPVHIAGEGHASQLGISMRLLSGMVVQPGPTVDDEDSGPLVTSVVVEDEDTVKRRAVVSVLQVARYEGHRYLQ